MIEPLTPPESDLQDFAFMPLHVARLRDSDLAAEASPEACWYAVMLWSASWHQLPAGSLPDNETVLTRLCGLGRDVRTFRKHKAQAMRGFILCSDGRLYHPVVAEVVNDGWQRKLQQRWRSELARVKKHNQRHGTDLAAPTFEEFLAGTKAPGPQVVPGDTEECPPGQSLQETGTGTGTLYSEDKSSDASAVVLDFDGEAWTAAIAILGEAGVAEKSARAFFGKLLSMNSLKARDLLPALTAARVNRTQGPQSYLTKAAEMLGNRRAVSTPKRVSFV